MPAWETKLKLGRKLKDVDSPTASANQASALFRYDETGEDTHVSLSIESDTMGVDDVVAVFQLLHDRGVLVASQTKTWVNQPTASKQRFGETTAWQGVDVEERIKLLKLGLKARTAPPSDGGAVAKLALVKVGELERKVGELRRALQGRGAEEASPGAGVAEERDAEDEAARQDAPFA